jgi:glycosyltransferase involved in cell wall biosynthesis
MKIAILSFSNGTYYRGKENWVTEFVKHLSAEFQLTVFQNKASVYTNKVKVDTTNIKYKTKQKEASLDLIRRAFLHYHGRKVAFFTMKILSRLLKGKYQVIIPTDGGWQPAIIRILAWFTGAKVVIIGHSGIGWDDRNNLWCFPDVFVSLSYEANKWAKKTNPLVKTVYIPDGVDLSVFKPGGSKVEVKMKKPIILCAAALIPSKRIDMVIKAVSKMGVGSLLIAGSGEMKERLLLLGNRLLKNRFRMLSVDYSKMPEVYRSADLFVSASDPQYSFEMVLLEAMATNLPVVANNDPIRQEIVGSAGMLADPANTKEFADTLHKTLNTDWKDKPRSQAKKYSWDTISNKYKNLFMELI